MSMIRAYDRSWVIQHHAARPMSGRRTRFHGPETDHETNINGVYLLPSANMDYVICYFRRTTVFPIWCSEIFQRSLQNPQGVLPGFVRPTCPSDRWAPLGLPEKAGSLKGIFRAGTLGNSSSFIKNRSEGLLIDSFGLNRGSRTTKAIKRL